jgi:hypothetical protein
MVTELDHIMDKVSDRGEGRIYQMWRAWMVMPEPRLQFHEIISREFGLSLNEAYILMRHLFPSTGSGQ